MAGRWYARVSPLADYVASGDTVIEVAPLTISPGSIFVGPSTDLGQGIAPQWLNATTILFYNRLSGSQARLVRAIAPGFTPIPGENMAFNSYSAGGDRVAGWNAGLHNVRTFTTAAPSVIAIPSASQPTVDTSARYAFLYGASNSELRLGPSTVIDRWQAGIRDPFLTTQGLAWSRAVSPQQTFGWRGAGVEALGLGLTDEFHPVVIDTPAGPWILYHSHTQLLLHPWGNTTAITVQTGVTDYPHGVYHAASGQFVLAWSAAGILTVRVVVVNILDPIYAVASGAAAPGAGGSGAPPNAPSITPTAKQAEAAKLQAAVKPKRTYPHVDEVGDLPAQKTLRLLWDRIFDLDEQLAGRRDSALKAGTAAVSTNLSSFQASQTLAMQQLTAASTGAPLRYTQVGGGGSDPGTGGGGGGGGQPPPGGDPSGGIANQLAVVQAARTTYDAFSGVERAGRIVNQVAWDLKNLGVGVVRKTSGTNWHGWSIDVIMVSPTAATYDILGDAEGNANPQWTRTSPTGFGDIDDWQAPVDPSSI